MDEIYVNFKEVEKSAASPDQSSMANEKEPLEPETIEEKTLENGSGDIREPLRAEAR